MVSFFKAGRKGVWCNVCFQLYYTKVNWRSKSSKAGMPAVKKATKMKHATTWCVQKKIQSTNSARFKCILTNLMSYFHCLSCFVIFKMTKAQTINSMLCYTGIVPFVVCTQYSITKLLLTPMLTNWYFCLTNWLLFAKHSLSFRRKWNQFPFSHEKMPLFTLAHAANKSPSTVTMLAITFTPSVWIMLVGGATCGPDWGCNCTRISRIAHRGHQKK